jgi:hypothetical protein
VPDGGGEAVSAGMHRAGPVIHYAVQVRGRSLEIVSAASPIAVGTACSLALTDAKIFPRGNAAGAQAVAPAQTLECAA